MKKTKENKDDRPVKFPFDPGDRRFCGDRAFYGKTGGSKRK